MPEPTARETCEATTLLTMPSMNPFKESTIIGVISSSGPSANASNAVRLFFRKRKITLNGLYG